MGVPAFYRWIQDKYPKCVVDCVENRAVVLEGERHFELTDTTGPNPNGFEVDNLYVDMNGLIHPCAHPENGEAPKTEEEMYRRVMAYVDRLVAAVRPRRVLYLAIDGVAPRAKMNQQRARRFRAAQEAEQRMEVEKEALEYMSALGHKVPSKQEKAWDSNVITPGTKFMAKLAKYLRFYIRDRINNNAAWKSIKVILSDAGVPGEGEHKLMQYIRVQRSQPGYDPNQHHVLHGLDADLIMLGLATHEVKFSILREEVLFGKQKYERERQKEQQMVLDANGTTLNKRKRGEFGEHDGDLVADDLKPLQYLHIATLREYLQVEFEPLSRVLSFQYDFERVVDDFVFLCFFVGNDFLPHLPSLDIRDGALDFLILLYAKLLPAMGGYLTDGGNVNLSRVDVILAEVGQVEDVIFQRRALKQAENERVRKSRLSNEKRDQIGAAAAKDSAVEILKKRRIDKDIIAADKKYGGLTPEEAVKARVKESVEKKLEKYPLYFPIGGIVPSPEKAQRHLLDIPNNQCYSFQYRLPPTLPHLSVILDGAQPPSPVLITENDKRITIPFFGKANINIVDLAGNVSNHTNVRQNYMSRHNGGGNGGRGGFGGRGGGRGGFGGRGYGGQQGFQQGYQQGNQRFVNNNLNVDRYGGPPPQQQYNQYMANGYGNWGSQEPRNKRGHYGESYNQYDQSSYGRPSSDYRGGYNGGGYGGYNNGNGGRGYQGGFGGRGGYQGGFGGRGGRGAPIQSAFGGSLESAQAYPSAHVGSTPAAPAPRGLEALKAGLRNMHQQRQSNPNGPPRDNTRYDR
eukprot:jgi/Phyca11/531963/estExt2_fgenesh1_pg.C_PHYCAscaffold_30124